VLINGPSSLLFFFFFFWGGGGGGGGSISYFSPKKQFGPQNNQFLVQLKKLTVNRLNVLTEIFDMISYRNVIDQLTANFG
jgi:hypothetical protein